MNKKNKLFKFCTKPKKAIGGLLFILMASMTSMSFEYSSRLSSIDLAKSMCDRAAYFVTFQAAGMFFNTNSPAVSTSAITDSNGNMINFSAEYNKILRQAFAGKVEETGGSFMIEWDPTTKTARSYNVSSIKTVLSGERITPSQQEVTIE